MTHQLMDVQREGYGDHILCIKDTAREKNQYLVYRRWYDYGWHKKKVAEFPAYIQAIKFLAAEYSYIR